MIKQYILKIRKMDQAEAEALTGCRTDELQARGYTYIPYVPHIYPDTYSQAIQDSYQAIIPYTQTINVTATYLDEDNLYRHCGFNPYDTSLNSWQYDKNSYEFGLNTGGVNENIRLSQADVSKHVYDEEVSVRVFRTPEIICSCEDCHELDFLYFKRGQELKQACDETLAEIMNECYYLTVTPEWVRALCLAGGINLPAGAEKLQENEGLIYYRINIDWLFEDAVPNCLKNPDDIFTEQAILNIWDGMNDKEERQVPCPKHQAVEKFPHVTEDFWKDFSEELSAAQEAVNRRDAIDLIDSILTIAWALDLFARYPR